MPDNQNTGATGNQLWILSFSTKPPNIEILPEGKGPSTKGGALQQHYADCFKQLDERLAGTGIQITYRGRNLGIAFLRGADNTCQTFKAAVEADGFAQMMRDSPTEVIY